MSSFKGKVVLITGGASGIGATCAIKASESGATVIIADLNQQAAEDTLASLPNKGYYFNLDICNESQWHKLHDFVLSTTGKLNVLIHCAGISLPGNIETTDFELWKKVHEINLNGTYLADHHSIKLMKLNDENNAIVNISSAMSLKPHAFTTAYCSSKAGVDALTKCVALHCGENKLNIRCNSVHPGAIHTPMLEKYLDIMSQEGNRDEAQAMFDANHPIGHCGQPDDIANAALFLASEDAKFITGALLPVDGAQSIA
ncbi:MAG: SDR family oxidoreductase [Colwellia sp.]|nr:SDR family oxidoreductase [Colwellia sp.]